MIGCGYPSFFVYHEHGYLNLDLQTDGVGGYRGSFQGLNGSGHEVDR